MTAIQRAYKGLCHVCLRSNVDTVIDKKTNRLICIDCNYHKNVNPKEIHN